MKYMTTIDGQEFEIEIRPDGQLLVNGEPRAVDFLPLGESALYSVVMDNISYEVLVEVREGDYEVMLQGRLFNATVLDERAQMLAARSSGGAKDTGEISIRSPMPGLIVALPVEEGQEISAGQTVVILESMKMENELKSPRDGIVQRITCEEGESVEQNKLLVTIT